LKNNGGGGPGGPCPKVDMEVTNLPFPPPPNPLPEILEGGNLGNPNLFVDVRGSCFFHMEANTQLTGALQRGVTKPTPPPFPAPRSPVDPGGGGYLLLVAEGAEGVELRLDEVPAVHPRQRTAGITAQRPSNGRTRSSVGRCLPPALSKINDKNH